MHEHWSGRTTSTRRSCRSRGWWAGGGTVVSKELAREASLMEETELEPITISDLRAGLAKIP